MIITLLLRAIFIYFLWTLVRRLWATYTISKNSAPKQQQQTQSRSKAQTEDVFEADFRVLGEHD